MKILKYVLLLLVLFSIATIIFVATLKPDYTIVKTKTIKLPKSVIYNYINEYKNWEEFGYLEHKNSKFSYPNKSNFSWKSQENEGKMQTISSKNDSIYQKMIFNGAESKVYWTFREANGNTKVTWTNVGKMDFIDKVFSNLSGGMDKTVGVFFEKSLNNINKNLTNPKPVAVVPATIIAENAVPTETEKLTTTKTDTIIVDGFQEKSIGLYVQHTINSTNANLESNIQIMIPLLLKYTSENKIAVVGKPFVKYNATNDSLKITNFSVCVPIKDSIKSKLPNKMALRFLKPFQCIKTTLNGNLSLKNEAKTKAFNLMKSNYLVQKTDVPIIEFYTVSKNDTKNVASWVTEIYVPVKKKSIVRKEFKPTGILPSPTSSEQVKPAETPIVVPEINIKKDIPQ